MPLVLAGATSGSTTLQATDTVTATLTIPSATGTLLSTGNPQSGGVIQVVTSSVTGTFGTPYFSTTTNGLVNTGLSASITPKFSTSKILIIVNACIRILGSTTDAGTGFGIARGSTNIWAGSSVQLYFAEGSTSSGDAIQTIQYLDSPATTSSTTYNFQVNRYTNNGGSTVYLNFNYSAGGGISSDISSITLMEIAA
jgi:hypothetical protein